jgi:hypothetical protein
MFADDFTKIEKTKIIPLRLFANFCNKIGTPFLSKMFYLQDYKYITSGFRWNLYGFIWSFTNKIYMRWGTYYKMNLNSAINKIQTDILLEKLGSDYDENGIPYWEQNG